MNYQTASNFFFAHLTMHIDQLLEKLTWFVFQFHNCLYTTVVVIYVDSSHHLGSLQVTNAQCNFADSMATNKFYYLCGSCELGVNL